MITHPFLFKSGRTELFANIKFSRFVSSSSTMSSSMKRKRPSLKRAAKVGEDGQGRKTYGVSSVPVNDEVDEIEQQSTPAPAVQAQIPASSVDHDDALDTDSSLSPTNSTSPIDPSFLNSISTLSGSHPGFGSASSQTITPRGQISFLPPSLVAPSEDLPVPFGRPEVWAEVNRQIIHPDHTS